MKELFLSVFGEPTPDHYRVLVDAVRAEIRAEKAARLVLRLAENKIITKGKTR